MKRSLIVLCVAALLATLPLARIAMAAKEPKVWICHVNSANDVLDFGTGPVEVYGRWIKVSMSALAAHADHGDCIDENQIKDLDPEWRDILEEIFDIDLHNANAVFPYSYYLN